MGGDLQSLQILIRGSITLDFMQRNRPLSAGHAAIQPLFKRYIQQLCDLLIAQPLGHVFVRALIHSSLSRWLIRRQKPVSRR